MTIISDIAEEDRQDFGTTKSSNLHMSHEADEVLYLCEVHRNLIFNVPLSGTRCEFTTTWTFCWHSHLMRYTAWLVLQVINPLLLKSRPACGWLNVLSHDTVFVYLSVDLKKEKDSQWTWSKNLLNKTTTLQWNKSDTTTEAENESCRRTVTG